MTATVPNRPVTRDELNEIIQKHSPFAASLGVEIIACNDGYAELAVPIRKDLTQFHGYAHGAVVGFVADSACAWAAVSKVGNVVTSEYKVNFMAPALGKKLVGRGYVLKASKRQVVCRADIFSVDEEGREKLVAAAMATIVPVENEKNE